MVVGLDDSPRQPAQAQGRRPQGRRASGLVRLDGDPDDRAVLRRASSLRSRGRQASRQPRLPRHPVHLRPSDQGKARALPCLWRGPVLSLPDEGHRRRRFFHRIGRPRSGDDQFRRARAGLCPAQGARARRPAAGPDGGAARRRRVRRGQHLRGDARGMETRCPQCLVDRRLQPPESRCGRARSAVRAHGLDLPRHGMERRHAEIRPAARGGVRAPRRRCPARLDRRVPERTIFGPGVPGRRGLARAAHARAGRHVGHPRDPRRSR